MNEIRKETCSNYEEFKKEMAPDPYSGEAFEQAEKLGENIQNAMALLLAFLVEKDKLTKDEALTIVDSWFPYSDTEFKD